ncbi:MAG: PAS domain S-box protein [Verrucomicrobiota bacterium]|nr:PAS domain S-box protein [Verrucomicrobiota bacterium]
MFEMSVGANGVNYSVERADELFEQHQQKTYRQTDRLFAWLMFFQWLGAILVAVVVSPHTWAGQASQENLPVWAAIFLGGAITGFSIWMTRLRPGAALTRHVIAVAQMLMSALLITLTGGRIETHFHVFGSLVILSFYRDWRVLIPATLVVAFDHFFRGIYWPYSVYGVFAASPWRSLEHTVWVVIADAFLIMSCRRSIREMRSIADRTAALEASEQGFRQIFKDAPIGMGVVGLDESFTQVNDTLCKMLGYSEMELTQLTTVDITFEEDVQQGRQNAEELLTGGARSSVERRYVHKNGQVIWITRTACLMRDVDGEPRAFLIMVEDISERKRGERELCESKRKLEAAHHANQLIMDNSQDVICTIDERGRFLSISAACESLWGYSPDELVGRPYIDFVCPEDRDLTNQVAEIIVLDGKISDFVNRYTRKDGSLVDILWSASWSKEDRILFCVAHDVTDRAKIEKALRDAKAEADRANQAKSEFLSRMSHELRTPLNAILGFSQLIERHDPTDAQRTRVHHILSAGRHLLNLINEVLDISRIEAGNLQLSLEPVCVADALEEALILMRPMAEERGVQLSALALLDQNAYVMADRQRLKQVMLNLLTNAVKYTPSKGKISVAADLAAGGMMRVVVSDTGAGIPAEKLARLFTPFDRLGAEQTGVEGTGLGLALCQRLMHAMNGSIGVDTTLGNGSSFWVELACAQSPLAHIPPVRRKLVRSEPAPQRTILYIEDNLSNLTLVEQMLSDQREIKLITAMQGQLGLELARQHSPDLILLDLHLPDVQGWEVLSRLQHDEATREIPVVVISADATSRQINRLMAAGARAYLTKPLDMQEFFRIMEETWASHLSEECAA